MGLRLYSPHAAVEIPNHIRHLFEPGLPPCLPARLREGGREEERNRARRRLLRLEKPTEEPSVRPSVGAFCEVRFVSPELGKREGKRK